MEVTAMSADDSLFEKAMARQMRGSPAGDGRDVAKRGVCPDAEILAAYHERLLGDDEMVLWKGHIASCARCHEVLAMLEAADDVLVNAETDSELAGVVDEAGAPLPIADAGIGHLMAQSQGLRPSPANRIVTGAATLAPPVPDSKRGSRNYWILSAGAIAAVFVVVLGVSMRTKLGSAPKVENVEVAEGLQLAARDEPPADAFSGNAHALPARPQAHRDKGSSARDSGKDSSLDVKREKLAEKKIPAGNSAPEALQPTANPNAPLVVGGAIGPAAPAPPKRAEANSEFANAITLSKSPDDRRVAPQSVTAGVNASTSSKIAARDEQDKETQSADALMQAQTLQRSRGSYGMVAAKSKATDPHLIAAPGGNFIWRVGPAGRIEQSTDAGATWKLQSSGVAAGLSSGSAPSDAVCWVTGAAGTILLTIDGGGHWTKLVSPLASNIGGILAVDALQATIWDATHGNTFVTSDGGLTWMRLESKPL
jgi:hypothetical protein